MTKLQIQTEIQKVLDNVPESVLQDVLDFLKELQEQPADKVKLTNNLRQILSEDKELLEKLAQWLNLKTRLIKEKYDLMRLNIGLMHTLL